MFTSCKLPPELDDQQLSAYLDDPDGNQETAHHLEQCEHCREKVKDLDRFAKRMKIRLYRSTCPSSIDLGEYYLHLDSASQRLVVALHLRECPYCSTELSELGEFLNKIEPRAGLFQPLKVIIARLISKPETASAPTYAALRGEMKGPLIFEAEDVVITLEIQPGPKGQASIQGQVAADDQDQWTGAMVKILQPAIPEAIAVVDALGAFRFEGVHSGSIQLRITSPGGIEVQVSSINITV